MVKESNKSVSDIESRWKLDKLQNEVFDSINVEDLIGKMKIYSVPQQVGIADTLSRINREHLTRIEKMKLKNKYEISVKPCKIEKKEDD